MKNLFQKFFGVLSKNSTQKDRTRRNVEIGRHLRQKVKGFDPRRFGRALYDHDETEFELESRNKILDIKDDLIGLTSYQKMNKIIVALGEERRTSFPILGRYYTFKYSPTTKQDKWDALPLVVCINYLSRNTWVGSPPGKFTRRLQRPRGAPGPRRVPVPGRPNQAHVV